MRIGGQHSSVKLLLWIASLWVGTYGCIKGPGFLKQDSSSSLYAIPSTDSGDGSTTGYLQPGSTTTQVLSASGSSAVAGASISFPPGSIGISTSITMEQGASVATSLSATQLGVGSVTSAAAAVHVSSSTALDTGAPFTISLPLPTSTSLTGNSMVLADPYAKLVVFYKCNWVSADKKYLGFIVRDGITIDGGLAKVDLSHFGSFQTAYVSTAPTTAMKVETTTPILTTKAEKALPAITWTFGTPTVSAYREASYPFTVTGLSKPKVCTLFGYEDKAGNYVFAGKKTDFTSSDIGSSATIAPVNAAAHTLFATIECEDESGRITKSGWSPGASISAKTSNGSGSTTSTAVSAPSAFIVTTLSAVTTQFSFDAVTGIEHYSLSWKQDGPNTDCTSGDGVKDLMIPAGMTSVYDEIRPLLPNTSYVFNLCAIDSAGNRSDGVIQTATLNPESSTQCDSYIGSVCTIINDHNLSAPADLIISGNFSIVMDPDSSFNVMNPSDSLTIDISGDLSLTDNASVFALINGNVERIIADDITISTLSKISASGRGDQGGAPSTNGSGPGGGIAGTTSLWGGGGGGNIGAGGNGTSNPGSGGSPYGTSFFGSMSIGGGGGGGYGAGGNGGSGGGYLIIEGINSLTVDGIIEASGNTGVYGSTGSGGGGAGGFISVRTPTLNGSGYINANGGLDGSGGYSGGGGGGGGIFIERMTNASSITCDVTGGASANPGASGSVYGCSP